jgi:hypothetical protein
MIIRMSRMDLSSLKRDLRSWGAALVLPAVASCTSTPEPEPQAQVRVAPPPPEAFWRGDGVAGSPKIVINLSEQRLRFYKGGELVGLSPVSTGRASYSTPSGSFRISEKDIDHRSSCYGDFVDAAGNVVKGDIDVRRDSRPPGSRYLGASMRYFMRVTGPVGMHEGYLPGYPASHGCIRLPSEMARILFRETPHGTPVQIVGHASAAPTEGAIPVGQSVLGAHAPEPSGAGQVSGTQPRPQGKARPKRKPKAPQVPRGRTLYLSYD